MEIPIEMLILSSSLISFQTNLFCFQLKICSSSYSWILLFEINFHWDDEVYRLSQKRSYLTFRCLKRNLKNFWDILWFVDFRIQGETIKEKLWKIFYHFLLDDFSLLFENFLMCPWLLKYSNFVFSSKVNLFQFSSAMRVK